MRPLVITEETKRRARAVKLYAEEHRTTMKDLEEILTRKKPPAGDSQHFRMKIFRGYRVVYSQERQPLGWCHHLSVSVDTPHRYPSPEAVGEIMALFGMGPLASAVSTFKDLDQEAINVLSLIVEEAKGSA